LAAFELKKETLFSALEKERKDEKLMLQNISLKGKGFYCVTPALKILAFMKFQELLRPVKGGIKGGQIKRVKCG
jgi:hypothetical protein